MKRTITFIVMLCIIGMANRAYAQEVKINTNLAVEADGTMRMDGAATVWDDLRVTLYNGSTSTAALGYMPGQGTGPQVYYFQDTKLDAMSFTVQLPHSWKAGTTIFPHIHWTPSSNNAGVVQWNLDYSWQNYVAGAEVAFPAHTPSTITVSVAANSLGKHLITPLTTGNVGLSGTGKTISSVLVCRIWRDANNASDTYNGDAGGLSLDFHLELDTFGSRSEYTK